MKKLKSVAVQSQTHDLGEVMLTLKHAGLRKTPTRMLVLNYLMRSHGPYTIEEIHAGIRNRSCNLTTVYRIIAHFVELGIVRRSDLGDRIARFEFFSNTHPHHHLICKQCKKVEVFNDPVLSSVTQIAKSKGFSQFNPWVEVFGVCNNCA